MTAYCAQRGTFVMRGAVTAAAYFASELSFLDTLVALEDMLAWMTGCSCPEKNTHIETAEKATFHHSKLWVPVSRHSKTVDNKKRNP
jgi:hypothetical protein